MSDEKSFVRDVGPVDAAAARWAGSGAVTVGVVEDASDKAAILAGIGRALSFPGYYGQNLDALDECVSDLSWLPEGSVVLVWADTPLLRSDPATHRDVVSILADAVAEHTNGSRPLQVVLVDPS